MTTTVKAADAAEFLALVPRMLGYTPTRSIVVVPMGPVGTASRGGARRSRSMGGMRLDLPSDESAVDGFAATLIGMVCRIPRAESLVAIVYGDEGVAGGLPHEPLASAVRRASDASGLELIDMLVIGPDGWASHLRPGEGIRPLTELLTFDRTLPPAPAGDQRRDADLPDATEADWRRTAQARRSLEAALEVVCDVRVPDDPGPGRDRVDPAALEAACELDDLPGLFERALTWQPDDLTAMRTAMLSWVLSRPSLRDIALVQWATDIRGGAQAMEAQLRWEDGADYPPDLASVMWGEGACPDPERLEKALRLARHIAARAEREQRPGSLAMCAWISWALGRSTHADWYAREALEIEEDHGLADIVRSFVAATHLPDWAFARAGAPMRGAA